jgi:type II secretory pathway component PulK
LDEASTEMNRRLNHPHGTPSASSGFALVMVIWISGFLAVFAISVTVSVRSHALFARNATSEVLAKGIADGLVQLTALQVAYADGAPPQDGTWQACLWFDTAQAWVAVQDQSGLVDLNTASPRLITALLEGIGLTQVQAADMSAAMRDFRDADDVADFGQSEAEAYSGRNFGPKNAPFEAVEELDQLPGMTPALFAELRDLTTVFTRQTGFDFGTAPERLLKVLQISRTSVAGLSFASPRSSRVSAITVAVQINDNTRFVRRAMIERTDQPLRPFVVLSWDGGAWPLPATQGTASTSCIGSGVQ